MSDNSETPGLRTAIVYDYDGTLARGNITDHTLLPALGLTKEDFWDEVHRLAERHDADQILIYMDYLLRLGLERGFRLTREVLQEHGSHAPLFQGVLNWFARINTHASKLNLAVEHYIVSSGLQEMILGSAVSKHMRLVFGSKFVFDESGQARSPGVAINYTNKTQFLFRINKGIDNSFDDRKINEWIPPDQRPIPFRRMIFVGDGETDIPCMKMVRHQGGHSVAVFDPDLWDQGELQGRVHRLISQDRCSYVAPANYVENQQLEVTIMGVLGRIAEFA